MHLAVAGDVAAVHAETVLRHRERVLAALVQGDQAANPPVRLIGQCVNRLLGRLLHWDLLVEHAGDDVVGDGVADKDLAGAGAGDAAGVIVGVGAGADERRVADAPGQPVRQPAGRGAGRQVAVTVQGGGADRPGGPARAAARLLVLARLPLALVVPRRLLPSLFLRDGV